MKKLNLIFIVSIMLAPIFSTAQTVRINIKKEGLFCGFSTDVEGGFYNTPEKTQYITEKAKHGDRYGIFDVVEGIKQALEINVIVDVYVAEAENNAMATTAAGGRKLIIADYDFLKTVNNGAGTEWAAVSILAHEMGHHISGLGRGRQGELDADYWSGYVLYKLKASKDAAIKCIMKYGTDIDIPGDPHPNKRTRARNIEQGWEDAQNGHYDPNRCNGCK